MGQARKIVKAPLLATISALAGLLGAGCASNGPTMREIFAGRPEPQFHRVDFEARSLQYAITGNPSGPLVLFVHGTPGYWGNFVQFLADSELADQARVVAMDRPGWGGSGYLELETSLAVQASAVAAVLREFPDNRPAIVVGHSLGGTIAVRAAMDFPELIDGAVIVSASLDPEREKTTWYQAASRMGLIRWAVPADLVAADEEIKPLPEELTAMTAGWSDLRPRLIVMQGDRDKLVPFAHVDYPARMAPHAVIETIKLPDQGHFIPWDNPATMRDAVLRLLSRLSSAPGK